MHRRILQIIEATDAGVGRHVLDLLRGLIDVGWEAHVLYSPLRMSAEFQQRLEAIDGLTAVPLSMRRSIHPQDVLTVRRIVQYVQRSGPFDVIHGHSSKGGALARVAGRLSGVPSVYTPNALVTMNPELGPLKSRVYAVAERWLGRMGNLLIAVSEEEREHAVSIGVPATSISVVPNGIAPPALGDRGRVRAELGLEQEAVVVGFVGRLFAQKAPQILIRAFAGCVDRHPKAVLAIVGDGPLRKTLEQLAGQLGISANIRWLGTRSGQHAMPAFDLFVLSSDYEGMPYVLLEAAHAGLPIVATRVSGVTSIVSDSQNGWVVAPGDADGMAQAIDALLSDAAIRARFSAASHARVDEWTCDRMVSDTARLYEQTVNDRPPAEVMPSAQVRAQ